MSYALRVVAILILLQGLSFGARAHMVPEDANGCHYNENDYHCHDQEGDAGAFLTFLATIGIFAYFLCDRVVTCGESDIPSTPPRLEADY